MQRTGFDPFEQEIEYPKQEHHKTTCFDKQIDILEPPLFYVRRRSINNDDLMTVLCIEQPAIISSKPGDFLLLGAYRCNPWIYRVYEYKNLCERFFGRKMR